MREIVRIIGDANASFNDRWNALTKFSEQKQGEALESILDVNQHALEMALKHPVLRTHPKASVLSEALKKVSPEYDASLTVEQNVIDYLTKSAAAVISREGTLGSGVESYLDSIIVESEAAPVGKRQRLSLFSEKRADVDPAIIANHILYEFRKTKGGKAFHNRIDRAALVGAIASRLKPDSALIENWDDIEINFDFTQSESAYADILGELSADGVKECFVLRDDEYGILVNFAVDNLETFVDCAEDLTLPKALYSRLLEKLSPEQVYFKTPSGNVLFDQIAKRGYVELLRPLISEAPGEIILAALESAIIFEQQRVVAALIEPALSNGADLSQLLNIAIDNSTPEIFKMLADRYSHQSGYFLRSKKAELNYMLTKKMREAVSQRNYESLNFVCNVAPELVKEHAKEFDKAWLTHMLTQKMREAVYARDFESFNFVCEAAPKLVTENAKDYFGMIIGMDYDLPNDILLKLVTHAELPVVQEFLCDLARGRGDDFDERPLLSAIQRLELNGIDAYEVEDSVNSQNLIQMLVINSRIRLLSQLISNDPAKAQLENSKGEIPLETACKNGSVVALEALLALEPRTRSLETLYDIPGESLAQDLKDLCEDSNFKEDVDAVIDEFFQTQVGQQLYGNVALDRNYDSDDAVSEDEEDGAGLPSRQRAF